MKGKVYLVGAGPGDPELLTLKALRVLRTADAVLYDDLVAPEILNLIPPTAQVHNVGKRAGQKSIVQEEINFLVVTLADSGMRVVRLKSGDPLIFGRGGEEIEALRQAGIPYEIVPGVTSALGAAAAAAIPLTHRRASSALVFITAHQASGSEAANWNKLAGSGATLVIYMPGQNYSAPPFGGEGQSRPAHLLDLSCRADRECVDSERGKADRHPPAVFGIVHDVADSVLYAREIGRRE